MSHRIPTALTIVTLLVLPGADNTYADNWPAWRGPHGNGICDETNVPLKWDKSTNVAWRLELPGSGGATPAVWGDHVFVTTVDGNNLSLMCVNAAGQELWRKAVTSGNKTVRGDEGNYASPSPVTDGKHVWSAMGDGSIACFDFEGNEVWKVSLSERHGPLKIAFGLSSTPVVYNGRVYCQMIHGDQRVATQEAKIVALDALSGETVWVKDRVTGADRENEHSYASPILYQDGKREYLVSHGADYTIAHDLKDGREIWRLGGLNPHDDPKRDYHPTLRFVASPTAANGMLICPTAKNGPVFAIRGDGSGDLTGKQTIHHWIRPRNTPDVPSPLIHGGLAYLCRENGDLLVLDAGTGEEIYLNRTHRMRHRASPIYVDGHVLLTARDGKITVVKAGREFEIVAQNELGESQSATPAISNGTIYLRTFDALWAIRRS